MKTLREQRTSGKWNYKVMLILKEHDLEGYIKDKFKEQEGDESKDMIKSKRIILDYIKDHLTPQVY